MVHLVLEKRDTREYSTVWILEKINFSFFFFFVCSENIDAEIYVQNPIVELNFCILCVRNGLLKRYDKLEIIKKIN